MSNLKIEQHTKTFVRLRNVQYRHYVPGNVTLVLYVSTFERRVVSSSVHDTATYYCTCSCDHHHESSIIFFLRTSSSLSLSLFFMCSFIINLYNLLSDPATCISGGTRTLIILLLLVLLNHFIATKQQYQT